MAGSSFLAIDLSAESGRAMLARIAAHSEVGSLTGIGLDTWGVDFGLLVCSSRAKRSTTRQVSSSCN